MSEILPAFQLTTNICVPPNIETNAPDAAAVAAVLACCVQPFRFADLFRASCGDLNFESTSDAVRAEAHARLQRDGHLECVFRGSSARDEGARRLGRCTLHPWQVPSWCGSCS